MIGLTWIPANEKELLGAAIALGAKSVGRWSPDERVLARNAAIPSEYSATELASAIRSGEDPLGDFFCQLRSATNRRSSGATYTPAPIVNAMCSWATTQGVTPERVVEPGVGSARFLVSAAKYFPHATLVGVDTDPLALVLARGHLAASGLAERAHVALDDYISCDLPPHSGPTLFIGNPPYVRHHLLSLRLKRWLARQAVSLGLRASRLAGLHVYFFLATALRARPGDLGAFITSAEWLDVNYGRLVRDLFSQQLGGRSLVVLEPTTMAFPDAATTAAIATFVVEKAPRATVSLHRIRSVQELPALDFDGGRVISRERLCVEPRWSHLTRVAAQVPPDYVELGELFRVHRGQVTGANRVWVRGEQQLDLPDSVLFRAVTRARELFAAGKALVDASTLRRVIDLPADLSIFDASEKEAIDRFLRKARAVGAHSGYIARSRKAWWSVGLRDPAPVLATYMARRPPAFVRNLAAVRHINVAHGLYPREPLPDAILDGLVAFLSRCTRQELGRTYAGGLTKFEPREMERIPIPSPSLLLET
ncbi:MAG TPA: N-6 DNA methylase [Thermoanaerobaculia bacterium]|jgi:hypothetical protein|nr:N-6 DNA methylase [Thermoanaerobaculia bacterium]